MTTNIDRVLVMTVGTGDVTKLEETLFTPLRKSIATDAWARVILLPSSVTEGFARRLKQDMEGAEVIIRPLPGGDENDADQAYSHFDSVLAETLRTARPENVVVDFTRGTKAMSAALVLAATRREIPRLRYITGPRDARGVVKAGQEKVPRETKKTTMVAGHRRVDLARDLMRRGDFSATEAVLPDPIDPAAAHYPPELLRVAGAVRTVARFYAAWDRLDYAAAAGVDVCEPPADDWKDLWPPSAVRVWVCELARGAERSDSAAMAAWLRRLVVDLVANGERRLRQGQHEDALVRAYRVLELIGQIRLFDWGLDSGCLDSDHQAVQALQRKIERRGQDPLARNRKGTFKAGRFQVARLLKECGDPLAKRLFSFDRKPLLKPNLRNKSLLIHGFEASAPDNSESLRRLFRELAQLIVEADSDPKTIDDDWFSLARTAAFEQPACG